LNSEAFKEIDVYAEAEAIRLDAGDLVRIGPITFRDTRTNYQGRTS
jgi:hypothetical protein